MLMSEVSQSSEVPAKKGVGCGALIAFIIITLILVSLGANEGVKYYFKHCEDLEEPFECLLNNLEEPEPQGAVTAIGTYSYKDYSVVLTMKIPLDGGGVTGSISGACDGAVKGNFDGQSNGAISGKISGVCSPFFVNIPASADFSGVVNKDSKVVPISFTGRGAGLTHKDSMSLAY